VLFRSGDFNPARDTNGYSSEFEFIPNQSNELEKAAETKHAKLKGMNQSTAEVNFLNKAKWLDMYGVDLQPVMDENNTEYFIGITPTGISVFQNKIKINSYFWPRITKLNYKGNTFLLNVIEKTGLEKSHVFALDSKNASKNLWKCCVDHHKFFRIKTIYEQPAKLSTAIITNKRKGANDSSNKCIVNRIHAKRIPRRRNEFAENNEEALIIDVNKINLNQKLENDCLIFKPVNLDILVNQNGLFGSNANINNVQDIGVKSPTASAKSISSYKCPNPIRRESASENEHGIRRRYGSKNRSRTRNSNKENEIAIEIKGKHVDTDSENERSSKAIEEPNMRASGRYRRKSHRSNSRGSNKEFHAENNYFNQQNGPRTYKPNRKSMTDFTSGANLIDKNLRPNKQNYEASCHETTFDENDINEIEKKRQIRRRKRSKSPGATTKPPDEILQHIKYNLIEQSGLNADQLREIPFVKIETSAPPFRISPHQKHRRYSPGRRKSGDFYDSKSSIAYLSNGTAHIIKTKKFLENNEPGVAIPNCLMSKPVSSGSAVNTKLNPFSEPSVNIGFSADSGCEDMIMRQN